MPARNKPRHDTTPGRQERRDGVERLTLGYSVTETRTFSVHAGALQGIVGQHAHARLAKDLMVGSRQRRRKPNIKKLIKEVQSSGLDVSAVKIAPDDTITVEIGRVEEQAQIITPFDAWIAKHARSA